MQNDETVHADRALQRIYRFLGFLLRRAHQITSSAFTQAYRDLELTPTQYGVLYMLKYMGSLDQAAVARLLKLDRSTTGMVVDLLVRRELVQRRKSEVDQRRYELDLTDSGRAVLEQAEKLAPAVRSKLLDTFTPAERKELIRLLKKFVRATSVE